MVTYKCFECVQDKPCIVIIPGATIQDKHLCPVNQNDRARFKVSVSGIGDIIDE